MKAQIIRLQSVTSTNDVAVDLARKGARPGTVVVADEQTAGRGRRGAKWLSPPGVNLYASFILEPHPFELNRVGEFGFIGAIATVRLLRTDLAVQAKIKWPNDVVVRGKKIAGVLAEAIPAAQAVVLGIGLNLNWRDIPPELVDAATSVLIETGHSVEIGLCLGLLQRNLDDCLALYEQGTQAVVNELRSWDCTKGKEVKVRAGGEVITGFALGIEDSGALILQLPSGEVRSITALGEINSEG